MIKKLKTYVINQQFNPGVLGIFINPFYIVRRELMRATVCIAPKIQGKTLDIGCGHRPYEKIFTKISEYVGIEFDSPKNRSRFAKIDAWYNGTDLPFENSSFDSIILTQVLEHVFNPDKLLSEISRVLKKDGVFFLSVPFIWDEHEQPHDYARYSSFGLKHLLTKHGFEIVEYLKVVPDIRVIFQLIGCYIHKILTKINSYYVRLFFYVLLISPFTIIGTVLSMILPRNQDLYLNSVIVASKR